MYSTVLPRLAITALKGSCERQLCDCSFGQLLGKLWRISSCRRLALCCDLQNSTMDFTRTAERTERKNRGYTGTALASMMQQRCERKAAPSAQEHPGMTGNKCHLPAPAACSDTITMPIHCRLPLCTYAQQTNLNGEFCKLVVICALLPIQAYEPVPLPYLGQRVAEDTQGSKQQAEAQRVPRLDSQALAFKVHAPARAAKHRPRVVHLIGRRLHILRSLTCYAE